MSKFGILTKLLNVLFYLLTLTLYLLYEASVLAFSNISRSSSPEVFLRKGVLKICRNYNGEHPYQGAISIKLLCNIWCVALQYICFAALLKSHFVMAVLLYLLHIFRMAIPKNTSGWLKVFWMQVERVLIKFATTVCSKSINSELALIMNLL